MFNLIFLFLENLRINVKYFITLRRKGCLQVNPKLCVESHMTPGKVYKWYNSPFKLEKNKVYFIV